MSLSQSIKARVTLLRLFGVLLALYVVLEWVLKAEGLATFFAFVLVIVGAILAVRLIRHVIRKSIWRLRYRLIVTYVFIGVVPIVLILTLAVLGTWIVVGQVAAYLVSSELDRRAAVLTDPVRPISQAKPADRAAIVQQIGRFAGRSYARSRDRRERSARHPLPCRKYASGPDRWLEGFHRLHHERPAFLFGVGFPQRGYDGYRDGPHHKGGS